MIVARSCVRVWPATGPAMAAAARVETAPLPSVVLRLRLGREAATAAPAPALLAEDSEDDEDAKGRSPQRRERGAAGAALLPARPLLLRKATPLPELF